MNWKAISLGISVNPFWWRMDLHIMHFPQSRPDIAVQFGPITIRIGLP